MLVVLAVVAVSAAVWRLSTGGPTVTTRSASSPAAYPNGTLGPSTSLPADSGSPSGRLGSALGTTAPASSSASTATVGSSGAPRPGAANVPSVTVAAVGDMVCDPVNPGGDDDGNGQGPTQCQHKAVSDQVLAGHPSAFLALGDTQYVDGTLSAYQTAYAPTFGRLLGITHPAPGNHEYHDGRGAGYYAYFGSRAGSPSRGYYSFDLGAWHLIALNSNCADVSCAAGSAQESWLRADLAAHPAACTLAYWHHPRWSHGQHGDNPDVAPLMQALSDAKAEIVLNGHDHDYERFTPRAADGSADPAGIREFVVGTGGRSLRAISSGAGTDSVSADSFGALFLTLTSKGYSWRFTAENGSGFQDSGSGTCH